METKLSQESDQAEVWKGVAGYETAYMVSNLGRVKSLHTKHEGRILKPYNIGSGYLAVQLNQSGLAKNSYVHRLVAIAFIENPDNKQEVNHKDLNRKNNRVSNLEWTNKPENMHHAVLERRKQKIRRNRKNDLSWEVVCEIRKLREQKYKLRQLAKQFGLNINTVQKIVTGVTHKQ